jgi:Tfp pilus assembly protein PilE
MSIYSEARGSVVLKIIIVILVGILIYVIYRPYVIREQEERYRKESRARMINLRTAQLQYITDYGKYASSTDTLISYILRKFQQGSLSAQNFTPLVTGPFVPESLRHSPKSLRPYVIISVDTTTIKKYVLEDPDGYGSIGSLTDDNRINKASWEE